MTELKSTEFIEEKKDVVDAILACFGFFSPIAIGILGINGNRIYDGPIPLFFLAGRLREAK